MENKSVFLESIIPKEIAIKDKIRKIEIEKLSGGKIRISYKAFKGAGPKPFTFPKRIALDENLGAAIGLYLGDGKTTELEKGHAEYVSKDKDLNLFMLDFFRHLGAKENDFTFTINYRYENEEEVRKKWSEALGIPKEKFRIGQSDRYKFSTVHIQINGLIFRLILDSLIREVIRHLKENAGLRRAFLKGIFAAEGSIAVRDNYINYISISYNSSTERERRDLYRDLLSMEGIQTIIKERQGNKGDIIVSNWNNYYKLWKISIFDLCKRKDERFLQMLRKVKVCFVFEKEFVSELFDGLYMNQKEIAKLIGTYQASVSHMTKGSFLLRIEQVLKLSQKLEQEKFSVKKIRERIKAVRMGPDTYLSEYSDGFLDMLFEIRAKN